MSIYTNRPNLMIGFHGCDEKVRNELVNKPEIVKISEKKYDWLGHGFYVWENNYQRALRWAEEKRQRKDTPDDYKPSVVGVIYLLEYCLDFTDNQFIDLLPTYYELFKMEVENAGRMLPTNKDMPTAGFPDKVFRELDCAVIEYIHHNIRENISIDKARKGYSELKQFDIVRGIFTEGGPIFEGAGIQSRNHIQICIRNLDCIKGFFIPRKVT